METRIARNCDDIGNGSNGWCANDCNADNAVVKRERRRQIRETLNAMRQLDQF